MYVFPLSWYKNFMILIESKDVGSAYGAEKQLFDYAFNQGIPMAILTDAQDWSFFLSGKQGTYHERCVYKLDFIASTTEECCGVFERYLNYKEVISRGAIENAKNDYKVRGSACISGPISFTRPR